MVGPAEASGSVRVTIFVAPFSDMNDEQKDAGAEYLDNATYTLLRPGHCASGVCVFLALMATSTGVTVVFCALTAAAATKASSTIALNNMVKICNRLLVI